MATITIILIIIYEYYELFLLIDFYYYTVVVKIESNERLEENTWKEDIEKIVIVFRVALGTPLSYTIELESIETIPQGRERK